MSSNIDMNARVMLIAASRTSAQQEPAQGRAAAPSTEVDSPEVALETVQLVAQRLESYLRSVGRAIEFKVDDESGRTVISVRDAETGELIRQIPNEEVLRLAEMAEDQTIVLLHETV